MNTSHIAISLAAAFFKMLCIRGQCVGWLRGHMGTRRTTLLSHPASSPSQDSSDRPPQGITTREMAVQGAQPPQGAQLREEIPDYLAHFYGNQNITLEFPSDTEAEKHGFITWDKLDSILNKTCNVPPHRAVKKGCLGHKYCTYCKVLLDDRASNPLMMVEDTIKDIRRGLHFLSSAQQDHTWVVDERGRTLQNLMKLMGPQEQVVPGSVRNALKHWGRIIVYEAQYEEVRATPITTLSTPPW